MKWVRERAGHFVRPINGPCVLPLETAGVCWMRILFSMRSLTRGKLSDYSISDEDIDCLSQRSFSLALSEQYRNLSSFIMRAQRCTNMSQGFTDACPANIASTWRPCPNPPSLQHRTLFEIPYTSSTTLAFFISTKSMSVSFIHHQCQTMPLYLTLLSSMSPSSSFLKLLYYTQSYCLPHRLSLPHCFHLHAISLQHSRHIQIVTLRHFPNTLSSISRTLFFLSPSLHIQSSSILLATPS